MVESLQNPNNVFEFHSRTRCRFSANSAQRSVLLSCVSAATCCLNVYTCSRCNGVFCFSAATNCFSKPVLNELQQMALSEHHRNAFNFLYHKGTPVCFMNREINQQSTSKVIVKVLRYTQGRGVLIMDHNKRFFFHLPCVFLIP